MSERASRVGRRTVLSIRSMVFLAISAVLFGAGFLGVIVMQRATRHPPGRQPRPSRLMAARHSLDRRSPRRRSQDPAVRRGVFQAPGDTRPGDGSSAPGLPGAHPDLQTCRCRYALRRQYRFEGWRYPRCAVLDGRGERPGHHAYAGWTPLRPAGSGRCNVQALLSTSSDGLGAFAVK